MDYCHACRRHLNGALACAGCGTPAEELRRTEVVQPAVHDDLDLGLVEPAGHRRASHRPAPAGRGRGRGRAAARSRRRRNRKVVFGSLGLALAVGALSLAELAMDEPAEDRASTVVQEDDVQPDEPVVDPSGSEGPEPVGEVTAKPSVRSTGSADASASPSAEPSPSESAEVLESPSPSEEPDPSGSGSPSRPTPPPYSSQPAPPQPVPSPTETCVQFLWWCT